MILEKVITVSGLWRLLSWKTLRILQIPTDDKTNCLVYEREHYCWVGDLIQTENDNSVFLGNHFFSVIGDTIKETNMHYFRVTGKVSFLFFFFFSVRGRDSAEKGLEIMSSTESFFLFYLYFYTANGVKN